MNQILAVFGSMNIENKTVLVTGSTDGVGRLVARRLADQGARVLIHGRDRTRGEQLLDEIRAANRGSAAFLPADFSSLVEVRRLADTVRQDCDRLDILINNAGIGSGGSARQRETSQDGHELRFAVNYLAGFLLTRVLLPLLTRGKPARIVNVSSLGQHPIDFDYVMLTRGYSGSRAYAQSKLAQIMFTFDLARVTSTKLIRSVAFAMTTSDGDVRWPTGICATGSKASAPRASSRSSPAPSRRRRSAASSTSICARWAITRCCSTRSPAFPRATVSSPTS